MAPEPNSLTDAARTDEFPGDQSKWALFLDLDGTLIDIAAAPDAVSIPAELTTLLARIASRLNGALAIVTGRLLSDIDRLLDPLRLPAAGLHGLEWRATGDGAISLTEAETVDTVRDALVSIAGQRPGLMLEDKGGALALHFRNAPDQGAWLAARIGELLASHPALRVMPGKMVMEVKPAGVSKYTAVRQLMRLPPFAGRVPVFVGDDVTDQDGFRAALEAGGFAVAVAERPDEAVTLTLPNPAAVRAWLARLAHSLEHGEGVEARR